MADPRSAMKEFRLLDRKRAGEGLTPAEEARYAQLRDLVQPDLGGAAKGGFDVDAAAAQLRESLLPAGARAAAPSPAEPGEELAPSAALASSSLEAELFGADASAPEPDPFAEAGALETSAFPAEGAGGDAALEWAAAGGEPPAEGAETPWPGDAASPEGAPADDLGALGDDAAPAYDPSQPYDSNAPAYDPSQPYDPNAPPYDASQPYDPNAPAYDPSQPYDPNAPPYDASQPYDPNAPPYDPSQPLDPNAPPYDASQPLDPNAPPYDASQPYDPNAPAYDPSQPYDPNALAYDASQPYDPNAAAYDASQPLDPNAPAWDASQPYDPDAPASDTSPPFDPSAPAWDASQPLDPNAPLPYGAAQPFDPAAYEPSPAQDAEAQPGAPGGPTDGEAGAEWSEASPLEEASLAGGDGAGEVAAGWDAGAAEPPEVSTDALAGAEPGAETWEASGGALAPDAGDPFATTQQLFVDAPDAAPDVPPEPSLHADAAALPPAGWDAEPEPPAPSPVDPAAFGEYDEGGGPVAGAAMAADEAGLDDGLAAALPFDAAAAAALAPGDVPEGFAPEMGEYDDTAGFGQALPDLGPLELPDDATGFHAAQAVSADGPFSAAVVDDDPFRLASGGSFDASADAAAPEWAGGAPTPPWAEGEPGGGAEPAPLEAAEPHLDAAPGAADEGVPEAPLDPAAEAPAPWEAAPEAADAAFALAEPPAEGAEPEAWDALSPEPAPGLALPEASAEAAVPPDGAPSLPEPEAVGSLDAAEPSSGEAPWSLPGAGPDADADAAAEQAAPAVELDDFAIDVDLDAEPAQAEGGDAASPAHGPDDAPDFPPLEAERGSELVPELPPGGEEELAPDLPAALPGPEPVLDFSRPDFSQDGEDDDAWTASAARPGAIGPRDAAPVLPQLELEDAAPSPEEIPTLEGEEVLEELSGAASLPPQALDFAPPPAAEPAEAPPAPAVAPAALEPLEVAPLAVPPAPPALPPTALAAKPEPEPRPLAALPCSLPGSHRVVVHTVEGQVRRGVLEDPDLAAATLALAPQPGAAAEPLAADRVKAIFFMLAPGEHAPPAEGRKVRVTFKDGRQVAGFSPDYDESGPGFFMLPVDTRTNTGRIWVYRAAARAISVT